MSAPKGAFWTKASSFQPKAQFRFFVTIDGLALEDDRSIGASGLVTNRGDSFADSPKDTNIVWYAKTIDKPGYQFVDVYPENYYPYGGENVLKAPAVRTPILKMPLKMTLVDPTYPNLTRKLLRWLRRTGYNDDTARQAMLARQGGDRPEAEFFQTIGKVRIYQLGPSEKNQVLLDKQGVPKLDADGSPILASNTLEVWTLHQAYPARVDFGTLDYSSSDLVEVQIDWVYTNFTCEMKSIRTEDNNEIDFTYFQDFTPSELEKPFASTGKDGTSLSPCQRRLKKYKDITSKGKEDFLALKRNQDCIGKLGGETPDPEPGDDSNQVEETEAAKEENLEGDEE